jgi:hypothetical protein
MTNKIEQVGDLIYKYVQEWDKGIFTTTIHMITQQIDALYQPTPNGSATLTTSKDMIERIAKLLPQSKLCFRCEETTCDGNATPTCTVQRQLATQLITDIIEPAIASKDAEIEGHHNVSKELQTQIITITKGYEEKLRIIKSQLGQATVKENMIVQLEQAMKEERIKIGEWLSHLILSSKIHGKGSKKLIDFTADLKQGEPLEDKE